MAEVRDAQSFCRTCGDRLTVDDGGVARVTGRVRPEPSLRRGTFSVAINSSNTKVVP
jgi:hypothetical protein